MRPGQRPAPGEPPLSHHSSGLVLGLMGSGEFEPWAADVDRWLLKRARVGSGRVLVLPTASAPEGEDVFERWAARGLAHYDSIGVAASVLALKTREDAARSEGAVALADCSMVFFSGGNPAYLARTLRDTPLWKALLAAMSQGLAYGGCSAGVACLAERAPDSATARFDEGLWQPGLGLIANTLLGPHWDALDAFAPGLTDFVVGSVRPGERLVGIDERTAMLGDGTDWLVAGAAGVHVYADGSWVHHAAGARFDLALTRQGDLA